MKILLIICFFAPLTFLVFGYNAIPQSSEPTQISQVTELSLIQPVFIEINEVPPPFDIGGLEPYVIWINGARVKVPPHYIHTIIEDVGRENISPIDIPNLHEGWLHPHYFEQPPKQVRLGRIRSLNDRRESQQ